MARSIVIQIQLYFLASMYYKIIYLNYFSPIKIYLSQRKIMSFQNTFGEDGSININVIPSFGHIINVDQPTKNQVIQELEQWKQKKGSLHVRPKDFDPSRYASFSVKEVVEEPVNNEQIHQYVEKSKLSRRLGW